MAVLRTGGALRRIPPIYRDVDFLEPQVLDGILNLLRETFHGQITIVNQNFRVVQVERRENFNTEELTGHSALSAGELNFTAVKKKISSALKGLEFGQVILVVKKGRLAQIERLQKERFSDLQGVYGDGI
ncbi:MAG: YezD family protein [Deltaproteobacteria bacterium]|nr:YezD family protein [Deltaproteobacteria bacterium]